MSIFADPNREAVGLDPIWTAGSDDPPIPDDDGAAGDEAETSSKKSRKVETETETTEK